MSTEFDYIRVAPQGARGTAKNGDIIACRAAQRLGTFPHPAYDQVVGGQSNLARWHYRHHTGAGAAAHDTGHIGGEQCIGAGIGDCEMCIELDRLKEKVKA